MKKNFKYAILSAIALVGAVSFSACSSSEDLEDVNPTYDGKTVKTQFTISLPWDKSAATRQTSDVVQEAPTIAKFRGMQDIVLIPFFSATDRTTRLGAKIELAANSMQKPSTANDAYGIPQGQLLGTNNAVLYKDVTIPVATSGFLFYGKALGDDGYENGKLIPAGLDNETSDMSFTLDPIMPTPVTTKGEALAAYLTLIAAAKDGTDATITWAGCADVTNASESWYSGVLGKMYTNFIGMKAGASSYVQAAVQDLYTSVYKNTDKVSVAIKNAILTSTYASDATASGTLTFEDAIKGYPGDDNNSMPDGAVALSWDGSKFTAETNSKLGSPATDMNLINMSTITYPASLYYYVNSSIKTSDGSRAADYVAGTAWSTILGGYSGTEVSPTTRSVAITDPIEYGVGRLDVTVNKLDEPTYYDRKGDAVTIPTGGFQLTGVLIGGQKAVDYKFVPTTSTTATEYTIYDKTINTQSPSTSVTAAANAGPTYTLALQTKEETPVYVALEFLNNSDDFYGFDGVVKKGCKFYMIAKLDPSADVATGNTVSGVTNTGKRVFMQDYNTVVTFTIGAGSPDENTNDTTDGKPDGLSDKPEGFANAYTTIPDLRTPQLELGFSVNLQWKPGITFTYTF